MKARNPCDRAGNRRREKALELGAEAFVFVMTRISGEVRMWLPMSLIYACGSLGVLPYADVFRAAARRLLFCSVAPQWIQRCFVKGERHFDRI